ncbi:hypothetical protein [Komagataeibacter sp. FNDCF1]|uniref:hypothetical protein n=1 Tax=Komagataeibacter sp. FNDCF1 TaxID=2878681 RepID=UPI001E3ABB7F|nr:hypothetical protein [Komagataeibacter sp. FNDCF1]MCE2563628.1 hypothetical protein [Komagataeibacter sp. FNDCF1]
MQPGPRLPVSWAYQMEEDVPPLFMPRQPAVILPVHIRLAVLALSAGIALSLSACSGKIGEDACISCSAEKTAASTDHTPDRTASATSPARTPTGQGSVPR